MIKYKRGIAFSGLKKILIPKGTKNQKRIVVVF
jgi:hypothetical protein